MCWISLSPNTIQSRRHGNAACHEPCGEGQGADICLALNGDGDRCGVVDDMGREIFADKIGVMLARDLSAAHKNPQFVVDVKSTGLYLTDRC